MKRLILALLLFAAPALVFAQSDNVKVDNKKPKPNPKEGAMNNSAIRKSKKKMNKQGGEFDKPKYPVPPSHPNGDKKGGKGEDKKESKKSSTKGKM